MARLKKIDITGTALLGLIRFLSEQDDENEEITIHTIHQKVQHPAPGNTEGEPEHLITLYVTANDFEDIKEGDPIPPLGANMLSRQRADELKAVLDGIREQNAKDEREEYFKGLTKTR